MKRKTTFVCLAALLALAVALPAAAKGIHSFTFNDSLKPFTASTNDINKSYEIQLMEEPGPLACFGCPPNRFAALTLVPYSTESGVWMVAEVGTTQSLEQIQVSFDAKDMQNCATCLPMSYIGVAPPTKAGDFSIIEPAKLAKAWRTYSQTRIVSGDVERPLYIAIGWRVKGDMLKEKGLVGFDNVNVMVAPAP